MTLNGYIDYGVAYKRQLALNTIEHIGSEPKYTEEGYIQFEYQGVIFLMETANPRFWWPWCQFWRWWFQW
jgi:hypothetical protein